MSIFRSVLRKIRDAFVGGLLAIIPIGITVFILWWLYRFIESMVGRGTPAGVIVERILGGRWIPGLNILLTIIVIILTGWVLRSLLGRRMHHFLEQTFFSVPVVRKMYRILKQFTNAILDPKTTSFKKVVIFEYPIEGIYVIGLVANENLGLLQGTVKENCLLIYAPTAPNPTSGIMLIVPEHKVTYIDIPVEDALGIVISSGTVLPEERQKKEILGKQLPLNLFSRFSRRDLSE
jgi:uncharacterized membrane protein